MGRRDGSLSLRPLSLSPLSSSSMQRVHRESVREAVDREHFQKHHLTLQFLLCVSVKVPQRNSHEDVQADRARLFLSNYGFLATPKSKGNSQKCRLRKAWSLGQRRERWCCRWSPNALPDPRPAAPEARSWLHSGFGGWMRAPSAQAAFHFTHFHP